MEMHFGVSHKELFHPLGLVGREIIGNEMNLFAARLVGDHLGEEGNKLLAGVPRGRFCRPPRRCECLSVAYSERVP